MMLRAISRRSFGKRKWRAKSSRRLSQAVRILVVSRIVKRQNAIAVTVLLAAVACGAPSLNSKTMPSASVNQYYLHWNSDHTVRSIRPAYPIDESEVAKHRAYRIVTDKDGRPTEVVYLQYGAPSNKSDFGAHRLRFVYGPGRIDRTFYDSKGKRVSNRFGVFVERYELASAGFAHRRLHLGPDGQVIEDSQGVAEYQFVRDASGRRVRERRINLKGEVVPEHNGFLEARFAFDANDYARFRQGYSLQGHPQNGPGGYHGAYFWFDENGAFMKEEFRDINGRLAIFPQGGYAKIVFEDLNRFGQWQRIRLYGVDDKPLTASAAVGVARYDRRHRRTSIEFQDVDGRPAENAKGVARFDYVYDRKDGSFVKRIGYDLGGAVVE